MLYYMLEDFPHLTPHNIERLYCLWQTFKFELSQSSLSRFDTIQRKVGLPITILTSTVGTKPRIRKIWYVKVIIKGLDNERRFL